MIDLPEDRIYSILLSLYGFFKQINKKYNRVNKKSTLTFLHTSDTNT